ncbi:MAG: quinolinate phosphoribosyl transferase [Candidatus Yanofskybacteria bacterium]|nr:quinolinate phosphoribosyl transferase [Candidatus Yanofskybacteria bacterium]
MASSKTRLPLETFDIPIHKIRRGYYSAVYFWRTKQILEKLDYSRTVLMQIFQKRDAVLCGTDEAIAILKLCSGYYRDPERAYQVFDRYLLLEKKIRAFSNAVKNRATISLWQELLSERVELEITLDSLWENTANRVDIRSLHDGYTISPWETVMTIDGMPQYFAHLESIYLGILARRTMVATNVRKVVEAAQGKPILFFADRFDHYENQTGDGYAATMGGAQAVATDIMGEWWGQKGAGTMPHALIACFGGNTVEATRAFTLAYPDVPCISLVDFRNDCVTTALDVAGHFRANGLKLWGVRLDTSENMVDRSIIGEEQMGSEKPTGVNPILVYNVRCALDSHGHDEVKIVVSGGFTAGKIEYFEKSKVPVDAYGCGSSLLKGGGDFTADIVRVDGKPCAKTGRRIRPNIRLQVVE